MRRAQPVRERILEVAERLFAEHGCPASACARSRRKRKSISHRSRIISARRTGARSAVRATRGADRGESGYGCSRNVREDKEPKLEDILSAFLRPALVLGVEPRWRPAFVKLRARLATEPKALSRKILAKAFDLSSPGLIDDCQALPDLPRAEVEWRIQFMLGAMFYTMAVPAASRR